MATRLDSATIPQSAIGRNSEAVTDNREWILREVQNGLPSEKRRLACALENQAFYDLDGTRYAPRREAETEFDFAGRPHREAGFTMQAVERLSEHTYNPGPQRKVVGDGLADSVLQQAYETVNIDALMAECDRLAHLNDVAAIQVEATNDPDKPIDLKIWGAEEFAVFLDPEDPRRPFCVVTIDRFNQQTRYRAWFETTVATFQTAKYSPDQTAGGRVAFPVGEEEHTYGTVPFAFLHYRAPVRHFWTPGPGTFLRRAELRINDRLSELDELIAKYARPIGIFKNVAPTFAPEVGPGRFMRLVSGGTGYTGDGFAKGGDPDASYLQASLAVAEIWEDLRQYMKQIASAVNLPFNALELDYQDAPSGISLVIRAAPLLTRAKARRGIYQMAETDLARKILECAGAHYGHPDLIEQAKAVRLLLSWADPRIPVPGPERDQADEWEMQIGLKSRVSVAMERYGLSRDQAIEHLAQVASDNEEAETVAPQDDGPDPGEEDDAAGPDESGEEPATKGE